MNSNPVDALLEERGKTHGDFADHARITRGIKDMMIQERGWTRLNDMQKETLDMIAHKIGRIIAGNADFKDHWDDISGYARLVSQRLK